MSYDRRRHAPRRAGHDVTDLLSRVRVMSLWHMCTITFSIASETCVLLRRGTYLSGYWLSVRYYSHRYYSHRVFCEVGDRRQFSRALAGGLH